MRSALAFLGLLSAFVAAPALAEAEPTPYAVGDTIAGFTLEDQHGDAGAVDATTRVILFSRDMPGGDLLKEALEDVAAETLEARGAVYVSDISGMPALVSRLMAVPAMRRRPYDLLLDREGDVTARLPDAIRQATLIHLDALRIERVEHASDVATIRASLGLEAGPE
ncbi:MAG: hypothetical protein NXI30_15375 [bacterium]|nr:hypothetical protein [bacterium]